MVGLGLELDIISRLGLFFFSFLLLLLITDYINHKFLNFASVLPGSVDHRFWGY